MFRLKPQIQYLLLLVVVGLLLFSCSVQSMRFDLPSNLAKCFAEELKEGSVAIGNYTLLNPNGGHPLPDSHNFSVEVKLKGKDTVLHLGVQVQSGQFSLTAYRDGDYLVCFWGGNKFSPPITFSIDFDWRTGVAWPRAANKSNIDALGPHSSSSAAILSDTERQQVFSRSSLNLPQVSGVSSSTPTLQHQSTIQRMAYDLMAMHDTLLNIQQEMTYLRERGDEMQVFNRKTTAGMLLMSMISFCVCFSVAGVQLLYLKNYFEKNKIL